MKLHGLEPAGVIFDEQVHWRKGMEEVKTTPFWKRGNFGAGVAALSESNLLKMEELSKQFTCADGMALTTTTSGQLKYSCAAPDYLRIPSMTYSGSYGIVGNGGNTYSNLTNADYKSQNYWYVVDYGSPTTATVKFTSYSDPEPNYLHMDNCCDGQSVVDAARKLLLDADSKELQEARFKNSCNEWTDNALRVFIERMMSEPENTAKLVEIAKQLNEEKKKKKECK